MHNDERLVVQLKGAGGPGPEQSGQALRRDDGDAAYRRLFELYKDKIYNTCLSFLQNTAAAEDTTQEVFLEVFESIHKFKGNSTLSTWIYRISVNKSLEQIRRSKRKKRFGKIISLFDAESGELSVDPPDFHHPGVSLEQKETGAALFEAMDKLPERQKTAFVLYHIEDLSYKEICEVMKLSLSSVESLLHRAKNNMKVFLEGYYREKE